MEIGFAGRTVLVTGAARGIGRGIVSAFAGCGARVVATDVLEAELAEAAALATGAAGASGGSVLTLRLDVTDAAAVAACVREIENDAGRLDVLVHVAGGVLGQSRKPIEEVTDAEWDAISDVNLKGLFHLCRARHESRPRRPHRRGLQPRRPGREPNRHPGLWHR